MLTTVFLAAASQQPEQTIGPCMTARFAIAHYKDVPAGRNVRYA